MFYSIVFLKQDLTIKSIILNVLNFSAAPYSWYIEMYLGLFLLIPFLNIVYNAMPSQKSKIWLILTFVILTSLPPVLNIYNFSLLLFLLYLIVKIISYKFYDKQVSRDDVLELLVKKLALCIINKSVFCLLYQKNLP